MVKMKNYVIWIQTGSLLNVKKDNIYKDVETRFDASNFEINRPLPKAKNKKVIGIIKEELVGQVMKEFVAIRAKTYSYLTDNNDEDKKAKTTQKYVIKKQT